MCSLSEGAFTVQYRVGLNEEELSAKGELDASIFKSDWRSVSLLEESAQLSIAEFAELQQVGNVLSFRLQVSI